jgi:hypothetical protein
MRLPSPSPGAESGTNGEGEIIEQLGRQPEVIASVTPNAEYLGTTHKWP